MYQQNDKLHAINLTFWQQSITAGANNHINKNASCSKQRVHGLARLIFWDSAYS